MKEYAKLLVNYCVCLQKGERLYIQTGEDGMALAREIAAAAWEAGAADVKLGYVDLEFQNMRFRYGKTEESRLYPTFEGEFMDRLADEKYHRIGLTTYRKPDPAVNVDHKAAYDRSKSSALKNYMERMMASELKWVVAPVASKDWAESVYPGDADGVEKLWKDLFYMMRLDQEDPVKAWDEHCSNLRYCCEQLNDLKLKQLHFRSADTDLTVGLAAEAVWAGGNEVSQDGCRFLANIPTEEVFTMPHKNHVDGHVRITKPFMLFGEKINALELTFVDGRVTEFKTDGHDEVFSKLLDSDAGACRCGEIALVDASSPINQFPHVFYNTLLDENATCHLALGNAYEETTAAEGMSHEEIGFNESIIHEDFMIGSEDMKVTGIAADGTVVEIMVDGKFTERFRR